MSWLVWGHGSYLWLRCLWIVWPKRDTDGLFSPEGTRTSCSGDFLQAVLILGSVPSPELSRVSMDHVLGDLREPGAVGPAENRQSNLRGSKK